ncbi:MAG: YtxH domain-containing protein [Acidobacteriaceae bacterium]
MSADKFLTALLVGAAAGATVALLFAPQSGVKTRRQLRRGFEDAGDCIRDVAGTVGDQAGKYVERGKNVVEMVADMGSSAYSAARKVVS